MKPRISMIAAIGKNRGLGKDNQLLFTIPDDLARFRQLTDRHVVIMGRKTFDSIGRPLQNRTNIVVSHQEIPEQKGIIVCSSLDHAVSRGSEIELSRSDGIDPEVFIIGGGQIYEQALPSVDRLYLTVVDATKPADTFFPAYEKEFQRKIFQETKAEGDIAYTFLTLERS